jgi:hypothetical protein
MDGKHNTDHDGWPDVDGLKAEVRKQFDALLTFCCNDEGKFIGSKGTCFENSSNCDACWCCCS